MAKTALEIALAGDITGALNKHSEIARKSLTAGVRRATFGLKRELRRQIDRAGFRASFAKAIRGGVFPYRQDTVNPVGRVFSKATAKNRPGGLVDLAAVFNADMTIAAAGAKWLAIPTENAERRAIGRGNLGDRKAKPSDYPGLRFRPVLGRPSLGLLVVPRRSSLDVAGTVYFILVKSVRLKQRLNIDAAAAKWL